MKTSASYKNGKTQPSLLIDERKKGEVGWGINNF